MNLQYLMQQRQENQFIRSLLAKFEEDQIATTHHIVQEIENNSAETLPLLNTLNLLLNNKALPSRQRRDVAGIARLVADSNIFLYLESLIKAEPPKSSSSVGSQAIFLETIKLIGGICWENPHFIDNILTSSSTIFDLLMEMLANAETIPAKDDSLITIVNFFHSISLKEGVIRKEKMPKIFTCFLEQIFTNDKFYDCLDSKKFSILFSTINKFHGNVHEIDKSIFNAVMRAVLFLNEEYKKIEQEYNQLSQVQQCQRFQEKLKCIDRRLVGVLRMEEKSRGGIFQKIDPLNFIGFLKTLAKIAVRRSIVFVESPYDNKVLINAMHEIIKDIKEWKEHLKHKFNEVGPKQKEEGNEMEAEEEEKIKEVEMESDMQVEQDREVSLVDANTVNSSYYEQMKPEFKAFSKIHKSLCSFSENYYVIVNSTIDRILDVESQIMVYESNANKKSEQSQIKEQITAEKQSTNEFLEFKLQMEGSRLDRLLSLFMRLMDEKQLMKDGWYKDIVSRLTTVFYIFSSKGLKRHIKTVYSLIPELNNMTTESNISKNRFIFEKIEQDSLKTHLHLKITAIQNAKNLISYTIIEFCYHLSEYSKYLQHINQYFLSQVIAYFNKVYLQNMQKEDKLSMIDIERLRMMTKVVTEIFPNIHKCNKEELMRLKLYNYCLLTDENSLDAFGFIGKVVNLICKHDLTSTQELIDTLKNREEMVKTIFVKLIIHRIRTFFATVITFYDDLRKLSTPRTIESPAGSFELDQPFMFQGHYAYVKCLQRALKQVLLGHRENSLKEEVAGMLLLKLYDFRTLDRYEGEDKQLEAREENFRSNQTNLFNKYLQQCCQQTFDWVISNMGSPIHKLSMLIKKLLHYKREQTIFQIERSSFNQSQINYVENCFRKVSENINNSFFILEGKYLNFGIKMAKKKRKINEDIQFQLGKEVVKLANTCVIVSQFMIESNNYGVTEKNFIIIPESYIYSLLEFATLYISKFEAELHFPEEANYLIQATLWLLECYLAYKNVLEESKLQKKKEKKRQRKAKRNKDRKQRIKARKIQKKIGQNKPESKQGKVVFDVFQIEDKENQQLIADKTEKHRPRKQKRKQGKQNPEVKHKAQQKTLQKNQSKTNLHSHNKTPKEQPSLPKIKQPKTKEKSTLQLKVEEYLKFILVASNRSSKPFIKCLTLQSFLKFISVNVKANYLSKPPTKHFELSLNIFLEQLLKIRLTDEKIVGFHLILSRLGLKLISEDHVKVDYQTGIKRYFFDNGDKKITLSQFLKFLELNFKKPPNLLHFVEIIYQQPGGKAKKALPFTVQNFTAVIETGKTKDCSVKIKEGVDLNMILVKKHQNQSNRKKSSNVVEEEKKEKWIKLTEYVPDGEINVFIVHLISHVVTKLITEIDYYLDYVEKKEARQSEKADSRQPVEPFNTKAIIYTIQYLIRESPTLIPWIAKFKCKRFILNALKSDTLKNKEKTSKYIFSMLNKYDESSENISQIGFLQVVLRLISPFLLSTISGLVFELCLDSTPLVQNGRGNEKDKEIKQGEKQQPNYVSFGSVVRQKTVSQLQSILFGGHPLQNLVRKAACLNLLTVLMNNREMSKLLLQANFINKLHGQYSSIMKKYEQESEVLPLPGIYFIKLYIPFFLEPISILQQLNIAFHHNKKLNKNSGKLLLNSLIMLTEDSINAQLIPADILKKNKFKSNWPFGKKEHHRKLSMTSQDGDNNQSLEDSFLGGREEYSDSDASDQDQGSNTSEELEERLAELDRMQEEEQYLSLESGPQSQLLNDQWDYSNSNDENLNSELMQSYPQHDDRIIQEQLIRQLNQNGEGSDIHELEDQQDDLSEDDLEQDEQEGDEQGEVDEEEGDIDLDSQGVLSQEESFVVDSSDEEGSFSDYFSSSASQNGREALSSRQQLIIEHKEQEQFYQHVMDVLSYEKINVVPKISRIQVNQVFNLRFFLQLYDFPQRKIENRQTQRLKSGHQLLQEKKVEESLELLKAFKFDKSVSLCHYIEMNQVYRYDFFMKSMPLSEAALSKMFTDEHTSVIARRRRNGIVHRGDFIQIMPGSWEVVGARRMDQVRRRRETGEEEHGAPFRFDSRNIRRPFAGDQLLPNRPFPGHQLQPNFTIRIIPNERLNAVESQSSSHPIVSEEDIDHEALSEQIPDEQMRDMPQDNQAEAANRQRFRQEFEYGNEEISQILRELNMNMTPQEFHMLSAEVQNDIIQNYYMIGPQQDNPPNSPVRPAEREPQPSGVMVPEIRLPRELRQRQPDMSPILGLQELDSRVEAVSPQNLVHNVEGGNNIQEQFRKMSMQHLAKVNKDVMQMINKEGKNNSKFYELQDSQLAYIFELFYDLNEKDHKHYPYNLIETLCMNTSNLHRFLSTCIALLHLALQSPQTLGNQAIQTQHCMFKYLQDQHNRTVLVIKILHLMYHLTGTYSIAMNLLAINDQPISMLEHCMPSEQKDKSSLEMLILFLNDMTSLKSPEALKFIIDLIENVTVHHFYKSIHSLVGNAREHQSDNDDINKPIQISKESAHLLGNLLQNDLMMQNLHSISRIIMRLSLNDTNLGYFIAFMEHLIAQLAQSSLKEIERICASPEAREDKKYNKIVNLMNIFFQMVISFKSYPTSEEKHNKVLSQLRRIVEIETLQQLCEAAANHLFASHDTNIQTAMGEILEVYFILYEIALATSAKTEDKKFEDLEHKHIAELGQIKEMRIHQSTELKKQEQIVLGKFNLSKMWRESIIHPVFKTYINNCIKKKLNNLTQEPTWATLGIFEVPIFKVAISTPHMLTFDNKRLIFKTQLKRLRKKAKSHLIHMQLSRQEVFEDSFAEIMHYNEEVLKGKLKIQFKDEEGEDAGGITREWFQLLSKKMFDPNYGLFKSGSSGSTYHPSEKSYINPLHLKYFKFIGRITGKALYDGYLLDAYFTPAFYKHILNLPITYLDMEEEDYEYFKSLKWIMDNSPIQDYLELNFNYSFDNFGQIQTKELFPGGGEKTVTEQNKYEYVQLISYAKMATSIKKQLQAFLQGFHDLIPHKLIKIFNEKELEIMISGRPTIDIDDLKNHTDLVNYVKNDQIIVWLFQVLQSFDMQLRTAFLQFVTGSSRVPVQGFKDLRGMNGVQKFNIHREFQEERLPRAHTCFNQLDLPNYKTKQILIEKLMLAITEGKEGFHMI